MLNKALLALLILGTVSSLFAQQKTGLLVSDQAYQKVPMLPSYSGVKYTEVPLKVSLKKYCPVPGDQHKTGACVGWAVGYGALTIQRAINSQTTDQALITQYANSSAFLYNQVRRNKTDCSEGAYLEDALSLLKEQGDCLERSFNFQQFDCNTLPSELHLHEAKQYHIQDYAAVFGLEEDPKTKIGKACKILATNTPLIVGIGVTNSFFEILPGAGTWSPGVSESITGYHAMVLTGYNNIEKQFELMNSFGPSWGQNGFIKLSFESFERLCRYAYVIVPAASMPLFSQPSSEPLPASDKYQINDKNFLSGEFVFRQPAGFVTNADGDELMFFEEIKTTLDQKVPGMYHTAKPKFQVGDVFQLVAREIPRGRYVYVFSQSADGVLNLHFPRKTDAIATAGFVLEKTVEIVIPGEESLLQIPVPGRDYLCILYSCNPIVQFDERLKKMESLSSPFPSRVQQVFSDLLIQDSQVQFATDRMSFTALASPANRQIATAIILEVTAE